MQRLIPIALLTALLAVALPAIALVGSLAAAVPALAIGVDRPLADPADEQRAHDIATTLRCLVCQNQTIAESDADLARDLRGIIREQVQAGRSNDQVQDYLVARYGQWILMQPPVNRGNALLWLAPALILLAGIAVILLRRRRAAARTEAERPLDPAEQARLAALLERDGA